MEQNKKSYLMGTPSWALSLLTVGGAIIAIIVCMMIGDLTQADESSFGIVPYIIYDFLVAFCCYFIVRQNPSSIWYVPIISNALGIISAFTIHDFWRTTTGEPSFWITPMWIPVCSGWVLSIIATITGSLAGKRKAISNKPST